MATRITRTATSAIGKFSSTSTRDSPPARPFPETWYRSSVASRVSGGSRRYVTKIIPSTTAHIAQVTRDSPCDAPLFRMRRPSSVGVTTSGCVVEATARTR